MEKGGFEEYEPRYFIFRVNTNTEEYAGNNNIVGDRVLLTYLEGPSLVFATTSVGLNVLSNYNVIEKIPFEFDD